MHALRFSAWISSKLAMFHWICLLFILLVSVGSELLLPGLVLTLSYNAVTCFLE